MEEIIIKVDIPSKLKNKLGFVLAKAAEEFVKKAKKESEEEQYKKFNEIASESKLSKENALRLGKELNKSLHLRYKKLYPKLK